MADSPGRSIPVPRGQCKSLALLIQSDCSWWTTLYGSATLVRTVSGSLHWRSSEQVRHRDRGKKTPTKINGLTEQLTGFVQTLFLASEGQGTSWVMTKSLQMAGQLWQRKPKETLKKKPKEWTMLKRTFCLRSNIQRGKTQDTVIPCSK